MTFSIARLLVFPSSRFLLFLVAAILFIAQPVSAQVVEIPDPNLESVIRETLELPDGGIHHTTTDATAQVAES